jgi:hypothetical protein
VVFGGSLKINKFITDTILWHPVQVYLLDVSYDDKTWRDFVLTYSFMQVQVKGRNLEDIILGIETNACLWIQEFDALVYSKPASDAPIIESIEILTPNSGDSN